MAGSDVYVSGGPCIDPLCGSAPRNAKRVGEYNKYAYATEDEPFSNRYLTTSTWPFLTASMRGVAPVWSKSRVSVIFHLVGERSADDES